MGKDDGSGGAEDLGGAAEVFGVGTPETPTQRAAKRRAENEEEEYQESIEAHKRLVSRAAAAAPTASQIKDDAFKQFIGESADSPKEPAKGSQRGCFLATVPPALLLIAAVVLVAGIVLGVLRTIGPDGEVENDEPGAQDTKCEDEGALEGGRIRLVSVAQECGADGDLASFAGTWVLESGLDDPSGIDTGTPRDPSTVTVGPSSADIVIEPDGSISGGSYNTRIDVDPGCGPREISTAFNTATGQVGANGAGMVTWEGPSREFNCDDKQFSGASGQTMNFWITGDQMVMCRSAMASASTCDAAYSRVVAQFRRAG